MSFQLDALGEAGPFEGFVEADFDAFERKKWGSRVYTLERRSARSKLVALARALLAEDTSLAGMELGASDDAPSMANHRRVDAIWAYLTREEALRRALDSRLRKTDLGDAAALFDLAVEHQHASLLFRLAHEGFRLELHVSPRARVDRANAAAKLGYEEDRAELQRLCLELPPSAQVGFESAPSTATEVDANLVGGWREGFAAGNEPFVVRLDVPRDDPRLASTELLALLREVISPLTAVYRHLAWSRDNDFAKIGVEEAVEKAERKLDKRAKRGPRAKADPVELSPGTRVTILSGLFAGRAGYLAELEGKGKVKVMVGPVTVSVPASDVKAS